MQQSQVNETESARRLRVLLVEDEFIIAMDLEARVTAMGCEVVSHVASGEEAVAQATTLRPDLIFMDVRLKGQMNGIEATARINEVLDIPVVFLSGQADAATMAAARKVRHAGYLTKPYNDQQLFNVIEAARNAPPPTTLTGT